MGMEKDVRGIPNDGARAPTGLRWSANGEIRGRIFV